MTPLETRRALGISFHEAASSLLRRRGLPANQARIAGLVAESRQNYHGYALGKRYPSVDKVLTWVERWNALGLDKLEVTITTEPARVHPKGRPLFDYDAMGESRAAVVNRLGRTAMDIDMAADDPFWERPELADVQRDLRQAREAWSAAMSRALAFAESQDEG